jgi:hypothetical protein
MTTSSDTTFAGYALSYGEYTATVEKIAKINERAAKRGFTGTLTVEATRQERTVTNPYTFLSYTVIEYLTRVTGEAPSYGGWTFLARIDRVGETFTIATAPGVDHVDRSLVRAGECDHCGSARRRNNTYLVVNRETGETKNVGSTCIKDFLGWDATIVFFSSDEANNEVEIGGGWVSPVWTTESVVTVAYAAIRAFGFVPTSSYDGRPTASWVSQVLNNGRPANDQERADLALIGEYAAEAKDKATDVLGYIASDDFAGTSTYVDNLKALVAAGVAGPKQIGLLASAPQAYARHLGQVAEREARKAQQASVVDAYLAPEGTKKVEVKGTISAIRYIEGNYGTTTLYTILTDTNHLVKWFSSTEALGDETNVPVHIVGTVKKHEEYNGVKSTVLTRCKAI